MNEYLLVVANDDKPIWMLTDVESLAGLLMRQQYGDVDVVGVYALGSDGTPVPVKYTVTGAHDFDADSWAHATVTVFMPDGSQPEAHYTIDGRA